MEYLWVGVYSGTALFAAAAAFALARPPDSSGKPVAEDAEPFDRRMDDAAFLREALARGRAEVALCAAAAHHGR
jgi:hypothetical protein